MGCNTDRFVLVKGRDNEFVFTIKQTGSTLPMQILNNVSYVEDTSGFIPSSIEVATQSYIPSVEEVLATFQVDRIEPLVEGSDETIYINGVVFTVNGQYASTYDALSALAVAINASSDVNLPSGLNAYVNTNRLYITATEDFILNANDVFSIALLNEYVAPVVGQEYVAAHRELTDTPVEVDITSIIPSESKIGAGNSVTSIKVKPGSAVDTINGVSADVDGWHDVGTASVLTIIPVVPADPVVYSTPAEVVLEVRFVLQNTITDTFSASLVALDTRKEVLTKALTIEDANSGKVNLLLTRAQVDALPTEKGPKVDRYYVRPMYELVVDCHTANNGSFIARICNVYVN